VEKSKHPGTLVSPPGPVGHVVFLINHTLSSTPVSGSSIWVSSLLWCASTARHHTPSRLHKFWQQAGVEQHRVTSHLVMGWYDNWCIMCLKARITLVTVSAVIKGRLPRIKIQPWYSGKHSKPAAQASAQAIVVFRISYQRNLRVSSSRRMLS